MPVRASASLSDGPSVRLRTSRTSGTASGRASHGSSSHAREVVTAGEPDQRRDQERGVDQRRVQVARAVAAQPDDERALARAPVGVDVADVVDHEDRRGERPHRDREGERLPRQLLALHVVGARHRDDPEEQEHEQLAEALVAVGPRAAGVQDSGKDRRRADDQQRPAGDRDQVDPDEHGDTEGRPRRDQHLARRDEPAGGDPHGAEAVLCVGAAAGVGVVVRQVGPDLDGDRADQRGEEGQPVQVAVVGGQRRADENRRHRRRKRPRPGGHEPDAGAAAELASRVGGRTRPSRPLGAHAAIAARAPCRGR